MMRKKSGLLALALGAVFCARAETSQPEDGKLVLNYEDAQRILMRLDDLVEEIHECSTVSRAPRPGAPGPNSASYPRCNTIDLTNIEECLCKIKRTLECVLEKSCSTLDKVCSIQDVIGECTDLSVLLPSVVDKQDIDNLCETVVSLLKTILLELRGSFNNLI